MSFDPRVNFGKLLLGNMISISAIVIMCIFVFLAIFFDRPFCNYFCYEGAKYGLMSYFRVFTIKRDESKCVNCKKCDTVCPMNIEVSKCINLSSLQCINCFQCVANCPIQGTLNFGKIHLSKNRKKKYLSSFIIPLFFITTFIISTNYTDTNPFEMKHNSESTDSETTIINGEDKNILIAKDIADGVYIGKGEGFKGTITVQITVKNQQIIAVKVLKHRDDRKWFNCANNVIPRKIIETQSVNVDAVSGATYSSIGIIDGVKNALAEAR